MNEEIKTHENEEKKIEEAIQLNEENEKDYTKTIEYFKIQVHDIDKNKEKVGKLTDKLSEEKEKREKIFKKYQESNKKYLDYQITLKNETQKMEDFKGQTLVLDKESAELIAKRNSLEQKLPDLENEKQSMVKSRNFKVYLMKFH